MSRPLVLVLSDEEVAPDLEAIEGWHVLRAEVGPVANSWVGAQPYRGARPRAEVEVVGAESSTSRTLAGRLLRRAPATALIELVPREAYLGEEPRPRFWLPPALQQLDALLDRRRPPEVLLAVGPRAQVLAWHIAAARPRLRVVTSAAAVPLLSADPERHDRLRTRADVLGRPDTLFTAVPDIPAEPHVVVGEPVAAGQVGVDVVVGDEALVVLENERVRLTAPIPDRSALVGRAGGLGSAPARSAGPRLLIGPANFSGQAAAWVRCLTGVPARNVAVVAPTSPFTFPADVTVSQTEWTDPCVRARLAARELVPATHVLAEGFRSIAGLGSAGRLAQAKVDVAAREIEVLRDSGRTVGVVIHGSEGRSLEAHLEAYPFSPFADATRNEEWDRRRVQIAAVHEWLERLAVPTFVTTPDMLDFVPGADWLPLALGSGSFRRGAPVLARRVPVVLHAPSAGPLKGSDHIDAVLGPLHDAGVVVYRRLAGVPSWELPQQLRAADVVIDQVVLGNPGVLAMQALAAGRLVVGHVLPHVRARYDRPLPVVEATPDTLQKVVLELVGDVERGQALSDEGAAFARELHDGRRAAAVLSAFTATSARD